MPAAHSRTVARSTLALGLALLLALGAAAAYATPLKASDTPKRAEDRFIVKFAPKASAASVKSLNARHGVKEIDRVERLGIRVLSVPKGKSPEALARAYKRDRNVEFAEPDYVLKATAVPNDTYYSYQWAMPKIGAPTAWDTTTGSTATTIAVIDTGIQASHPDLAGRVVAGYDFVNNDSDPTDDEGHGTSCAGIIGATGNNGAGVAGLDWRARLLPVKVLDSTGNGYTSDIAEGITYATDKGARVISMSLGGSTGSTTMKSAVDYAFAKGVFLAGATGNDSAGSVSYPAAYSNVMAVGATDQNDARASFSNWGTAIDITAPGVSIATAQRGGGYAYFSGTSAATPFVAGIAGLALAKDPSLTPTQITSAIRSGAVDLGTTGWDDQYGWGRISAARMLAAVPAPSVTPPPATEPTPTPTAVDNLAPAVVIASPVDGQLVSASGTVRATASDNVGVTRVEFRVDGIRIATDTTAEYAFVWDTTTVKNGEHVLTAVAYDAAGNSKTSAPVTVNVKNRRTKR